MAKGKLRIRQRGSRQQWAHARTFKEFGSSDAGSVDESLADPNGPPRPLGVQDIVATTRCGLCSIVVEQKRRDGGRLIALRYSLCISCDEVRCQNCWLANDDVCSDADEHELFEVHYADGGVPRVSDFASF